MAVTVHWCPISRKQPSAVHLSCPTAMDQAMPNSTGEMVSTVFCVALVINGARSAPSQSISVIQVSLTVSQQSVKVEWLFVWSLKSFCVYLQPLNWWCNLLKVAFPSYKTPVCYPRSFFLIFLLDNGVSRGPAGSLTHFTGSGFCFLWNQVAKCRTTLKHGKAYIMGVKKNGIKMKLGLISF